MAPVRRFGRVRIVHLLEMLWTVAAGIFGRAWVFGKVNNQRSDLAVTASSTDFQRRISSTGTGYCGYPDTIDPWKSPLQICGAMAYTEEDCVGEFYDTTVQCRWDEDRGFCTSDAFEAGDLDVVCPFTMNPSICDDLQYFGSRRCVWYDPPTAYCGYPDEDNPWALPLQVCDADAETENSCEESFYNTLIECRWVDGGFCTSDALEAGDVDPLCPASVNESQCNQLEYFGTRRCSWFAQPTPAPSLTPSNVPTAAPTFSLVPSSVPSSSHVPSTQPTSSAMPSLLPTSTVHPSLGPSSHRPSAIPTISDWPSTLPSKVATRSPSAGPTKSPIFHPTKRPTPSPSKRPTAGPTKSPTASPTRAPTPSPTVIRSLSPTVEPTLHPSVRATSDPTNIPSEVPSVASSFLPSPEPSLSEVIIHSTLPTILPSRASFLPTTHPSQGDLNTTVVVCVCSDEFQCLGSEVVVALNSRFNLCVTAIGPATRLLSIESMSMSQGHHGKTIIDSGQLQSDTISLFKMNDSSWITVLNLPIFFVVDELVIVEGSLTVERHDHRLWLESGDVSIDFYATFFVVKTDANSANGDGSQSTELPAPIQGVDPTAGQKEGKKAMAWQWLLLLGTVVVLVLGLACFVAKRGWIAAYASPAEEDGFSAPYSDAVPDEGSGSDPAVVNLSDMALPSASMLAADGSNSV